MSSITGSTLDYQPHVLARDPAVYVRMAGGDGYAILLALDADECVATDVCNNVTEVCVNTEGSFRCDCAAGFARQVNGTCVDTDECFLSSTCNNATEVCVNTAGGFRCDCADGFARQASGTCVDTDECFFSSTCNNATEVCVNTEGGFLCDCADGFARTTVAGACVDINECSGNRDNNCGDNTECVNTPGSYTCPCDEWSTRVEQECTSGAARSTTTTTLLFMFVFMHLGYRAALGGATLS